VLSAIRTAFQGETVGQVYEGNRVFDVNLILPAANRKQISEVVNLPIRNSVGQYMTLSQVASVYETAGRYIILHDGARRVQTITANVAGGDVNAFVNEARKRIGSQVSLPA
jgi:Cu/Ag efflux pump CusA